MGVPVSQWNRQWVILSVSPSVSHWLSYVASQSVRHSNLLLHPSQSPLAVVCRRNSDPQQDSPWSAFDLCSAPDVRQPYYWYLVAPHKPELLVDPFSYCCLSVSARGRRSLRLKWMGERFEFGIIGAKLTVRTRFLRLLLIATCIAEFFGNLKHYVHQLQIMQHMESN